jgi:fructokinase
MLMTPAELDQAMLRQTSVFHYGSITLIEDPIKSTTLQAIEWASQAGALISYDPNWRPPLWPSPTAAKAGMLLGFAPAHVVKMSEEELTFLTDQSDLAAGVRQLWTENTRLVVITKGEAGCEAFTPTQQWTIPGFSVRVEDTIGAGDGFVAGLLAGLLGLGNQWPNADLTPVLRQANAVGALTTTKRGGIQALPTLAEVQAFLG